MRLPKFQAKLPVLCLPLCAPVAVASANGAASQPSSLRQTTIQLHSLKASACLGLLLQSLTTNQKNAATMLPGGVDHIDTDDVSQTIAIEGTEAGIEQCSQIIAYLDAKPKRVELDVTFVRHSADKSKASAIVGYGKAIVTNNETADIVIVADRHVLNAQLTPRLNADGTTTLKTILTSRAMGLKNGLTTMTQPQIEMSGCKRLGVNVSVADADPFAHVMAAAIGLAEPPLKTASASDPFTYIVEVKSTEVGGQPK